MCRLMSQDSQEQVKKKREKLRKNGLFRGPPWSFQHILPTHQPHPCFDRRTCGLHSDQLAAAFCATSSSSGTSTWLRHDRHAAVPGTGAATADRHRSDREPRDSSSSEGRPPHRGGRTRTSLEFRWTTVPKAGSEPNTEDTLQSLHGTIRMDVDRTCSRRSLEGKYIDLGTGGRGHLIICTFYCRQR